ncbi:MAG: PTS sugar transporter subunit IIB [Olsenella sp.]|nr:PTS sugar transporter subunit IIB [Olsenella sp.]
MRKVAKKEKLNVTIHAVSKSEIMQHADKVDVILLGPHFAAEVPTVQKEVANYGVKVGSVKPDYYAALDGEAILRQAIDLYNGR